MLSTQSIQDKNSLSTSSVFLTLLELQIPSISTNLRLVNNNEDIVYNSHTYLRFPFEIQEIKQSVNSEISSFVINISNVTNEIAQYIKAYDDYIKLNSYEPIKVILCVVNSKDLSNTTPLQKIELILTNINMNLQQVSFTVSAKNTYQIRVPKHNLKKSCRFKFKSTQCGYSGDESVCNKSLARCKELSNSSRFGGFASIGNQGISI